MYHVIVHLVDVSSISPRSLELDVRSERSVLIVHLIPCYKIQPHFCNSQCLASTEVYEKKYILLLTNQLDGMFCFYQR